MKLSIIIPVFNEEKTIEKVLNKILLLKIKNFEKEIIIVDDGSKDKTPEEIKNIKNNNKKIIFLKHANNLGKGSAVRSGIEKSTGDYILIQDADFEYNPEYIEKLVGPILREKAEVVYGTRLKRLPNVFKEERNPRFLLHYFGNRVLSGLTSLLYGQWITDMETGYKLFSARAIKGLIFNSNGFDFEAEITAKLLKKGYKIREVAISTNPRGYSEGKKLNTFKDGFKALWKLLKYRFSN